MSQTNEPSKRDQRSPPPQRPGWEVRADARTAEFIVRRLERTQDELADFVADFRTLQRYREIGQLSWILQQIEALKNQCQKFADTGRWDDAPD